MKTVIKEANICAKSVTIGNLTIEMLEQGAILFLS